MAILVTGGTGLIGINLVKKLAEKNCEVVSLSRGKCDNNIINFIGSNHKLVRFVSGDVLEPEEIIKIVKEYNVDTIIHAAALTPTRPHLEKSTWRAATQVNIEGMVNILEVALAERIDRLIYISSALIYGKQDPERSVNEDIIAKPEGLYAITKYAAELLALRHAQLYKSLDIRIIRVSSVYGPMERPTIAREVPSLIYGLCNSAINGRQVKIVDSHIRRDFTYVEDTVEGIILLSFAPKLAHRIYNISSGIPISLSEILPVIKRIIPTFDYLTVKDSEEDKNIISITRPVRGPLDISRAQSEVGFTPEYDLDKGINTYFNWLKS